MAKQKRVNLNDESFQSLVQKLGKNVELVPEEKSSPPPWGNDGTEEKILKTLLPILEDAGRYLPLIYQERYLKPLKDNLPSILVRANRSLSANDTPSILKNQFSKTIEILAGAVYCHTSTSCIRPLRAFLAVISNTFRSFVPESPGKEFSSIKNVYPPLAAFRHGELAPYMLSSDAVKRLSGGTVGVVVLPASYMEHPLLWTAVAHEVGGHELMHAVPEILQELQKGVRQLFNVRFLRSGEKPDRDQLIGLVWRYWAEETISDVCGVLNIGPSYGISLSIYQAALLHAIAKDRGVPDSTLLRLWSTLPPKTAELVDDDVPLPDLDLHPTDILKIHVIIGAVENLATLSSDVREEYIKYFTQIAGICAKGQNKISLCGSLNVGPDRWIRVKEDSLPLELMQEAARRVGAYIATAELNVLEGRSLQQLETWDDTDEADAQYMAQSLIDGKIANLANMGDDAELLAASTLAFVADPARYEELTEITMNALEVSCARDPYWGVSQFHSLIDLPDQSLVTALEAQELLKDPTFWSKVP